MYCETQLNSISCKIKQPIASVLIGHLKKRKKILNGCQIQAGIVHYSPELVSV